MGKHTQGIRQPQEIADLYTNQKLL
jgi:hypothetical protein